MKRWNEIVSAYEAERQVLEAARREYDETAKAIVEDVRIELTRLVPTLAEAPLTTELVVVDDEMGPGTWVCALRLQAAGVTWAWIGCWVASAYDGPPGVLRVAAHVSPGNAAVHLLDVAALVGEASTSLGHVPSEPAPADAGDEDTVGLAALDLGRDDLVKGAAEEIVRLARQLVPLILQWHAAECPARALLRAKATLQDKPLVRKQTITPKSKALGREGATRYVWLDNPKPSVWVGVNTHDGNLYAIHDDDENNERLAQNFAKKLGGRPTSLQDHSAVVLKTKNQLKKMTEEEIEEEVLVTFRAFYEVSR